jgi:hypothetical protein
MPKPQKPKAAYAVNGWYLEIPGLISPRFETLSGLKKSTGSIEVVDAGSNVKYKFASQIIDFGTISLTRNMDGSVDDINIDALSEASISSGLKFAGVLVKLHFGKPVFSIGFEGLRFTEDSFNDFNIESEEKMVRTYQMTVDTWLRIP